MSSLGVAYIMSDDNIVRPLHPLNRKNEAIHTFPYHNYLCLKVCRRSDHGMA
jgi:hypothetical protein